MLQIALGGLRENEGGFAFAEGTIERLSEGLGRVAAGRNLDDELDALLRLAVVLRTKRGAPALADALGQVLAAHPEARRRLGLRARARLERARGFARSEGRDVPLRAPSVGGEPPPPGAIRASSLIDPTRRDRQRARVRKEAKE